MDLKQDTDLDPNFRNFDRHGRVKKLSQPNIIGYFSIDRDRRFIPDASNCKYLKLPAGNQPIHMDLNKGYEIVERKSENVKQENIDHLLKYILFDLKKLMATETRRHEIFLQSDVICFRGALRMLMCTPYEDREEWSLLVTKFKGNIYICGHETPKNSYKRRTQSEQLKKICSYGFKFEQYMMSDSPTSNPNTDVPVRESEEFCCMFTTKLDGMRILFGAEMDGIDSDKAVDLSKVNMNELNFTELKVRIKPTNERQIYNFKKHKMLNWWCQSHLANVKKIVVGHRTKAGIVDEIETIDVETLPSKHKELWSNAVCLEFLHIDCPYTVYKYYYDSIFCTSIQYSEYYGLNRYSFLPDWYTDKLRIQQDALDKQLL